MINQSSLEMSIRTFMPSRRPDIMNMPRLYLTLRIRTVPNGDKHGWKGRNAKLEERTLPEKNFV